MPSCLYWCIPLQICLTCSIHWANNTSDASIFFLLRLIRFMKENDLWNAFRFFFSSFFLRTDFLSGRERGLPPFASLLACVLPTRIRTGTNPVPTVLLQIYTPLRSSLWSYSNTIFGALVAVEYI